MSRSTNADEKDAVAAARKVTDKMLQNDAASRALGISIDNVAPGQARATMAIRPDMVNGHDICHGGLIFTLADTAFAFACNTYGPVTVASAASIEFLQPARLGDMLSATAKEVFKKGRRGIYDVEVINASDERIAVFRGRSATLRVDALDE